MLPEHALESTSSLVDRFGGTEATYYHVVGLYNTGTNFAASLLSINNVPNSDAQQSPLRTLAFKHYPFTITRRCLRSAAVLAHEAIFVVLLRHPWRWIKAVEKSPYELRFEQKDAKGHVDLRASNHGRTYREALIADFSDEELRSEFSFDSLASYWIKFYSSYLIASDRNEIRCVFVRYEDLVEHTIEVLDVLIRSLGGPHGVRLCIPIEPSKSHGNPVGYFAAREKLKGPVSISERLDAAQTMIRIPRNTRRSFKYRLMGTQ